MVRGTDCGRAGAAHIVSIVFHSSPLDRAGSKSGPKGTRRWAQFGSSTSIGGFCGEVCDLGHTCVWGCGKRENGYDCTRAELRWGTRRRGFPRTAISYQRRVASHEDCGLRRAFASRGRQVAGCDGGPTPTQHRGESAAHVFARSFPVRSVAPHFLHRHRRNWHERNWGNTTDYGLRGPWIWLVRRNIKAGRAIEFNGCVRP
jgi:hypothetical protein